MIPMHGHAFTAADPSHPAAFVPVTLRLLVKGTRRVFVVTTDANGNFAYFFQPLFSEAGFYQICADHPAVMADTIQSSFALYGMSFSDGGANQTLCPNASAVGQVTLQNLGDLPLTGLSAVVEGAPPELGVQVVLTNGLAGGAGAALVYQLNVGSVGSSIIIHARIHVRELEDLNVPAF